MVARERVLPANSSWQTVTRMCGGFWNTQLLSPDLR